MMKEVLDCMAFYSCVTSSLPTGWENVDRTKLQNNRLGNSITGVRDFMAYFGYTYEDMSYLLEDWAAYLDGRIMHYCRWLEMLMPIKTRSIKPSGTVSLISNVDNSCQTSPGVHPHHAPFYIRRIRAGKGHKSMIDEMIKAGFEVEFSKLENLWVVSYPSKAPEGSITKRDITVEDQFKMADLMQRHWADNQVSITITFTEEETDKLAKLIYKASVNGIKGISLLKVSDTAYPLMPYEAITEERYNKMMNNITHVPSLDDLLEKIIIKQEATPDLFCDGDKCMMIQANHSAENSAENTSEDIE
jgi:hypothetical protein